MLHTNFTTLALSFVFVLLGFLFSFWPLELLGVIFAAAMGNWVTALLLAMLLDVVWGKPTGFFHTFSFPVTLVALVCVLLRAFGLQYLRGGRSGW